MKYTVRALLSLALLLGVYVLALAIVATLVFGVFEIIANGGNGAVIGKLFIVAAVVVVAIGRGLWAGLKKPEFVPTGVVLDEHSQPRLWAEVRELAEQVQTRAPDEIRLVPEVNAAVSEDSRWLGLVPGTRRMYVGAPLLTGLTAQQLRSVLAHELGHYSGRHTGLAGVTYRGKESLRRVIAQLGPDSWVGKIFNAYGRLYVAVASSVNRRQELEADTYSARIAGKRAAASALQELAVIDAAWSFFLHEYASMGQEDQRRPAELFAGFHRLWTAPERQRELEAVRTNPPERQRSAYDSHPPVPERIAAIERSDASDEPDLSGSAVEVLVDPSGTMAHLEEWMFSGSGLVALPWDQLVSAVVGRRTAYFAGLLATSASRAGVEDLTLARLLDEIAAGRLPELVAPFGREDWTAEDHLHGQRELTTDFLSAAALDAGASYRLSWGGPTELVSAHGEVLSPQERVADVVAGTPGAAEALRSWCADHGLSPDFHVVVVPERSAAEVAADDEPRVHAALAPVTGKGVRFLVVLNYGVVLRKPTGKDRVNAGLHAYGNPGRSMLKGLFERYDAAALVGDQRSTFLPWSSIASVSVRTGRTKRVRTEITTTDGRTRKVKTIQNTFVHGEPFAAMAHYLGDRYLAGGRLAATRPRERR